MIGRKVTKCNYTCTCCYESETNSVCDNCELFRCATKKDLHAALRKLRRYGCQMTWLYTDIRNCLWQAIESGLDIIYMCLRGHYVPHRYSSVCKDWRFRTDERPR